MERYPAAVSPRVPTSIVAALDTGSTHVELVCGEASTAIRVSTEAELTAGLEGLARAGWELKRVVQGDGRAILEFERPEA